MLAASHSIGRNAIIDEEVAAFLGNILLARYPDSIAKRYSITVPSPQPSPAKGEGDQFDGYHLIEAIAKLRGYRIRGKEFDLEKAAITLLQDYRTGALGRISLETPASRAAMLQSATLSTYNPPHTDS